MIILQILGILLIVWILGAIIGLVFSKEKDGFAQIACILWPILVLGQVGAWISKMFKKD